jgi:aminoglycoside phosphotransferase (APT) family kinase protein
MSFVEGTSLEPLFDPDGEDDEGEMAERMEHAARTMATLHALDPETLGLGHEPRVRPAEEVDRWARLLETVDPTLAPGWEEVAAALRANEPSSGPDATVHGDLRLGNMLAAGSRITAVIDWEIWSVSDPRVDVGWFLTNADPRTYGRRTRYVRALPSPAELTDVYRDELGRGSADLEWFRALACFKSTATWAAIVKHNRRRPTPDGALEEMTRALPHLLERAQEQLG